MTKDEFLKWLSQYKYAGHYREMVTRYQYTPQELDWMKSKIEGRLKVKKETTRSRGA